MTVIKNADIDVIAKAMAQANHIGAGDVPARDVHLYHERAKLFLAASAALPNIGKTTSTTVEPKPVVVTPAVSPLGPVVPPLGPEIPAADAAKA